MIKRQIDAVKLRAARKEKGLSSAYTVMRACAGEISVPTYMSWESITRPPLHRFDYNNLLMVASLLGVAPDDITSPYAAPGKVV